VGIYCGNQLSTEFYQQSKTFRMFQLWAKFNATGLIQHLIRYRNNLVEQQCQVGNSVNTKTELCSNLSTYKLSTGFDVSTVGWVNVSK